MANKKTNNLRYPVIQNQPVAEFYYQGKHSHPVQRRIVITRISPRIIVGYELMEGTVSRTLASAPIKSYLRAKIALIGQCGRRLRKRTPKTQHSETTLKRMNLVDLLLKG